ncbi:MAG: DnaD domain protein [Erysipelotrichaceae bacterium]|nr:DnaD domain protein [Erysipelotrichaceae bacterium]
MIERSDWNSLYINKSLWLFDHLENFSLSPNEALCTLVINFLNETGQPVTYEALEAKCHMSPDELEDCFDSLSAKGYLTLDTRNHSLKFILDGFLDTPLKAGTPISQPLLMEFQEEFGRTFSSSEMEKIISLGEKYEEGMVLKALDEAAVYDKRSLQYIENILISWKNKGLSLEDVENGKR